MEWMFWFGALGALAVMDPHSSGTSLCLFEAVGIPFCPGHGLGHSIAFTFRGEWAQAFSAHPLGPLAILILGGRIIKLWIKAFNKSNTTNLPKSELWQT